MTVDKLGENKVLIILCNKDMEEFSIDFERVNLHDSDSRRALIKIMKLGCSKAGVEICNRNVDIEALPFDDECYILITVYEKNRRSYRIKDAGKCVCYSLGGSGNFLDTLEKLYRLNICSVEAAPVEAVCDAACCIFVCNCFVEFDFGFFYVFGVGRSVDKFLFHYEEAVAGRIILGELACRVENIILAVVAEHHETAY